MIILITGGSASGKSAYGETRAVSLSQTGNSNCSKRYYIATMNHYDEEGLTKIQQHQEMRKDKNFLTIEQPFDLENLLDLENGTILLECLSNLLANEMFREGQFFPEAKDKIWHTLKEIFQRFEHVVIISNEIFYDDKFYDSYTEQYLHNLGWLNQQIAQIADEVVEIVYRIPIFHKEASDEIG